MNRSICWFCRFYPRPRYRPQSWRARRTLSATSPQRTDGVYKALTEMRVRTPWIEAFRKSREVDSQPSGMPDDTTHPNLTPKRMSESHTRIVLPLAQDPWLLDTYANASGQIRFGALLMDLDALSGIVAYKHTGEGVTTVTAAVDRITIKNHWKGICDLELSGQVTYATGRSSMEISCQIARTLAPGQIATKEDIMLTCAFTMVSLDPSTKKPVPIPPLKIESEEEKQIFAQGAENYKAKRALRESSIKDKAPNAEESSLIYSTWKEVAWKNTPNKSSDNPSKTISMKASTIYDTAIMQPQYRNRHNFMIFGGYLLKSTFELAFACAAAFSHCRPVFLSLDPSTFQEPVPVGSVLYARAAVVYTEPSDPHGTRIQVSVQTRVRNVEHEQKKETGTFNYTFHVDNSVRVAPWSYDDYMLWIDGRRRAQRVAASLNGQIQGRADHEAISDTQKERMTE